VGGRAPERERLDDPNVYTRPFTIAFPFRRNALKGAEVWEEANGLRVYPGITAKEAKELEAAWQAREGQR
jgi:hypothetical protein